MFDFERLYDEHERVKVRFIGFTTDDVRYDFGIVYTNMFFGKPLVVCMQTGRSTLLGSEDATNFEHLQHVFRIPSKKEAKLLAEFLFEMVPNTPLETQYE